MGKENILLTTINEAFYDYMKSEQYVKNNLFNINTFEFCKEVNNIEYGIFTIQLYGKIDTENRLKAFIINNVHFVVENLIIDVSSKFLYFDIRIESGLIHNIQINIIENHKILKKDKLCIPENYGFYLPCRSYRISSKVFIKDDIKVLPPIIFKDDLEYYNKISSCCECKFYPYYNIPIYLLNDKKRLYDVLDLLNENLKYYHLYLNYSLDEQYLGLLKNLLDYYLEKTIKNCDITFFITPFVKNKLNEKFKKLDMSLSKEIFGTFYNLYLCFDEIKIKDKEEEING